MAEVGIKELLEAGVHFGHQTRRWNPKMRRFIFGERGGIYIIDLLKTQALLEQAQRFATEVANRGGTVLFVGTKKQARDGIRDIASAAGMPYVNHRWLGGLLTNYQTMAARIKRLHDLERYASEGQLALLPTRERLAAEADLEKLQANLGGVKNMQRVPDAMFVIDLKTEAIAVREAQRLRIPIIGLVDTNCDPDGIDYVIPGNDDAIRACTLITHAIGDVVQQGRHRFRAEEEQARAEAAAAAQREAEERARREAEERAAAEAAERAAAEEALTQAGTGEPRDVAEAAVAEAVETAGRPVEGRRAAEAGAAAQAADEPAMPAAGSPGPPLRERQTSDAGEKVPQEAGAAGGQGSPASDTAEVEVETVAEPPARESRGRARKAKAKPKAAPKPGPSPVAAEAEAAAPADQAAADEAAVADQAAADEAAPAAPAEETAPAGTARAKADAADAAAAGAETPDGGRDRARRNGPRRGRRGRGLLRRRRRGQRGSSRPPWTPRRASPRRRPRPSRARPRPSRSALPGR
jgi:small subunit ribosomal protein S2